MLKFVFIRQLLVEFRNFKKEYKNIYKKIFKNNIIRSC